MSVPNMKTNSQRPNEEPYVGKLLVRFREGVGKKLPALLDKILFASRRKKKGLKHFCFGPS